MTPMECADCTGSTLCVSLYLGVAFGRIPTVNYVGTIRGAPNERVYLSLAVPSVL